MAVLYARRRRAGEHFLNSRTVDPGSLFVVWAGANDFFNGQTNVSVPVDSLAEDIGRLVTAGARQFLVPTLPLLGLTPKYNGNPTNAALFNARSEQFNAAMDAALDGLLTENAELDLKFHRLDVAGLISDAVADPAAFGLTNVTDSAAPGLEPGWHRLFYNTSQIAANQDEYLFWDSVHPTRVGHALLAEQARMLLLGLPGDYNQDGLVDAADYTVWRDHVGAPAGSLANDVDGGVIGAAQYETWKMNFGMATEVSGGALATTIVPEPATLLLVVAGVFAIFGGLGGSLTRPFAEPQDL